MRRFYGILLIFFISVNFLAAETGEDLSWNVPAVSSRIRHSWLQEKSEVLQAGAAETSDYDFALENWQKFSGSWRKYFRVNDNSSFFYYGKQNKGIKFALNMSLQAGVDCSISSGKPYNFMFYGLNTAGRIGENLFFHSDMWTGHFSHDNSDIMNNSPLIDGWTKHKDDQIFIDNVKGKLLYRSEYLEAAVGRGKYEIGSNIGGSIILADYCNEYGYLNLDLKLGDFQFSVFNASLVPDSTTQISGSGFADFTYLENKYLTLHKVDWRKCDKVHVFIGESVIYGGRALELSYQIPFSLLRVTEHNLGDPDNMLIFAGFDAEISSHNRFYFNLILDELRKAEITTDWWGNKYALQAGNAVELNWGFWQRTVMEFTLVRPWLYTHDTMLTKYSHDKHGLGFPEGSNLIQAALEMNFSFSERLALDMNAAFIRQGNTGSNWEANYNSEIPDIDEYETALLAGDPENRIKLQAVISWQPLAHHYLKAGFKDVLDETAGSDEWEIYFSFLTRY
ncbi:MAG: hypothetical protein K9N06_08800 [Candidatus Cloacimonetes bacterium]|nr:hypothetical protein [Candidatus Cloacimonadota bacterium]